MPNPTPPQPQPVSEERIEELVNNYLDNNSGSSYEEVHMLVCDAAAEAAANERTALDFLAIECERICNAYGDKGWAKTDMVVRLRSALREAAAIRARGDADE